MIEKMTPEELKAVFDLSDTSDLTKADFAAANEKMGCYVGSHATRLLKHYHPELFVDPRLEAAKKLAREILAEEYEKMGTSAAAQSAREGIQDHSLQFRSTVRALLMDPPTGEADDA